MSNNQIAFALARYWTMVTDKEWGKQAVVDVYGELAYRQFDALPPSEQAEVFNEARRLGAR